MQRPATADGHLGVAGRAVTNEQADVRAPLRLRGVKRLSMWTSALRDHGHSVGLACPIWPRAGK
jgi:hypothetical protein